MERHSLHLWTQAVLVVAALFYLEKAVQAQLGRPVGTAFILITALQFHLPFYASRTLPNTFALACASVAHAEWLAGRRPHRTILLLAFSVVSTDDSQDDIVCMTECPHTQQFLHAAA